MKWLIPLLFCSIVWADESAPQLPVPELTSESCLSTTSLMGEVHIPTDCQRWLTQREAIELWNQMDEIRHPVNQQRKFNLEYTLTSMLIFGGAILSGVLLGLLGSWWTQRNK